MECKDVNVKHKLDIIPIQGPSEHTKSDKKMRKFGPYFSDPLIIQRVKQYVEENNDANYIDLEAMVTTLQKRYREYNRRKRSAFRGMVEKAFLHVVNYSNEDEISGDNSSEEGCYEDDELETNRANNRLLSLYFHDQDRKVTNSKNEEKETINISSSDDEEKAAKKLKIDQNSKDSNSKTVVPIQDLEKVSSIFKSSEISVSASALPLKKKVLGKESASSRSKIYSNEAGAVIANKSEKRKALEELKGVMNKKKREVAIQESQFNFTNIGGNTKVLEDVCKLLVHIKHPEVYKQVGVTPPRGFLLHGPPGCGKTLLAQAIAGELKIPMLKISAPELVAGVSGESEERIRDLFDQAVSLSPCVLFLDEVDAITPHRITAQREMERRIVAQLLTCLDELGQKEGGSGVLVIGATNRPDALDPALRRAGRFDREVSLGIPNQDARADILRVLCANLRLAPGFSFEKVAQDTPGFVGADLTALMREAAMFAVDRVFSELKGEAQQNDQQKPAIIEACDPTNTVSKEHETKSGEINVKCSKNEETNNLSDKMNNENITDETIIKTSVNGDTETEKSSSNEKIDEDLKKDSNTIADNLGKETLITSDSITTKCSSDEATERSDSISPKADVSMLAAEALSRATLSDLMNWLHRQPPLTVEQLKNLYIEQSDFSEALKVVQPSAKREGFATVPDVTWDDVGSLQDIREELQLAILAPVRHEKQFMDLGLTMPTGLLLCGPPGCGKTLLAKAVANEAGINFISVKGPELLNMYVGESERAVRQCFQRARNSAPCVIFFDELDSLCPKRTDSREGGASMRVVNQMLTEMDGVEGRRGVFLLAATNRPDIVDPAVLRPGRLDKILYVGLPGPQDRADILLALTKNGTKPRLAKDVNLSALGSGSQCDGFTGADLAALVREAAVEALKEHLGSQQPSGESEVMVAEKHFQKAFTKIRPSVSEKDMKHYEKLQRLYAMTPNCPEQQ